MKKTILSVFLFCFLCPAFSQSFMHGAGITVLGSSTGGNFSYGEGLTYSPRFNFVENEKLSVSVGIPLSLAISVSTSTVYDSYFNDYTDNVSVGFVINAPLIVNLNMGRGSTKENRQKFGYFVGAGFGYHHGDFLVDETDAQGYNYVGSRSLNTFGPAANAGVRFGVGRKYRNIEVRLSYMKGLNDTKPNVFGISGLFNF
ncbi:MAG: hypothetical protein IPI66_02910 [Chitinophagaceae bacterium]|nr:hypothetical protein [Chitinophagaceae bacterium]MBL0055133.1 hypothetical protein [Chitinophagaceae bacterium]